MFFGAFQQKSEHIHCRGIFLCFPEEGGRFHSGFSAGAKEAESGTALCCGEFFRQFDQIAEIGAVPCRCADVHESDSHAPCDGIDPVTDVQKSIGGGDKCFAFGENQLFPGSDCDFIMPLVCLCDNQKWNGFPVNISIILFRKEQIPCFQKLNFQFIIHIGILLLYDIAGSMGIQVLFWRIRYPFETNGYWQIFSRGV